MTSKKSTALKNNENSQLSWKAFALAPSDVSDIFMLKLQATVAQ
jgi:hypothetical protein